MIRLTNSIKVVFPITTHTRQKDNGMDMDYMIASDGGNVFGY